MADSATLFPLALMSVGVYHTSHTPDTPLARSVNRLDVILGIKEIISGSPFDSLDQLYRQILWDVPPDLGPKLIEILAVIGADLYFSASQFELLLPELEMGDLRLAHRILKVFSSGRRSFGLYFPNWKLVPRNAFACITSIVSPDFLPLAELINPVNITTGRRKNTRFVRFIVGLGTWGEWK
ncbi:hypothetical protein B0H11DRAFT_2222060 [Mycena galericulata]|nr:hypothetical protein B0H11DRAFT_2222060 [Mycena galericulata]